MLNATDFSIFSRYYLRSSEQCDSKLADGKNKAKRRKRKGINFLLHTYYLIRARYSIGLFLYVYATIILFRGKSPIYTPNLYPLID